MPGREEMSSGARPEADVLGLLADALLGHVEELIAERIEALTAARALDHGERWLRVSEVAARVGACERTVYRALRSGRLAGERLGARWRIRPEGVEAWLASSSDPRPAPPRPARAPARHQRAPRSPAEPTDFRSRARARTRSQAAGGPSSTTGGDSPQEVK